MVEKGDSCSLARFEGDGKTRVNQQERFENGILQEKRRTHVTIARNAPWPSFPSPSYRRAPLHLRFKMNDVQRIVDLTMHGGCLVHSLNAKCEMNCGRTAGEFVPLQQ